MRFFLDHNLPPRLASALDALSRPEHEVVHKSHRFDPRTADAQWIRDLGVEGGWVVVSQDLRITRNKAELDAWMESGLTIFFLDRGWAELPFWEKSSKLVQRWPQILQVASSVSSQVGYLVPVRGAAFKILRTR